jgi:hypothetical protein
VHPLAPSFVRVFHQPSETIALCGDTQVAGGGSTIYWSPPRATACLSSGFEQRRNYKKYPVYEQSHRYHLTPNPANSPFASPVLTEIVSTRITGSPEARTSS